MNWKVKAVLISGLLALLWSLRGNYLAIGCYRSLRVIPAGLMDAMAELLTISTYQGETLDRHGLAAAWCEPLRQPQDDPEATDAP